MTVLEHRRRLDPLEAEMVLGRAIPVSMSFRGVVHEEAIKHAWWTLCANFPILRAQIHENTNGYEFRVPVNHMAQFLSRAGDESTLRQEAYTTWNMREGVARLLLIRGSDGGFVSLLIDHAVADGAAVLSMLRTFWSMYTDIVAGSDVAVKRASNLPRPPTKLLGKRWGEVDIEAARSPVARSFERIPPVEAQVTPLHGRISLSEEETLRLRRSARSSGTSVHGILCGAILVALRGLGQVEGPARMACWSMVDLRGRVNPPIAPTETTNCVAFQRSELAVGDDPIEVAHLINQRVESDVAARRVSLLMSTLRASRVETSLPQHLANASVSNARAIPSFEHPAELEITDLFWIPPHHSTAPFPVHAAFSYGGALNIFCTYPSTVYTEDDLNAVVENVEKVLVSFYT